MRIKKKLRLTIKIFFHLNNRAYLLTHLDINFIKKKQNYKISLERRILCKYLLIKMERQLGNKVTHFENSGR
jgi:hypothetical protein